jgi:hypothetical protein
LTLYFHFLRERRRYRRPFGVARLGRDFQFHTGTG